MPNRERRKGLDGEREAAAIWRKHGFDVRGLEGEGDHTVTRAKGPAFRPVTLGQAEPTITIDLPDPNGRPMLTLHSEVKRCETARPWAWYEQAWSEAPAGAVPVVAFRRSRSPWLALIALDDLARLLA